MGTLGNTTTAHPKLSNLIKEDVLGGGALLEGSTGAPGGVILASAGYDHTIKFWDIREGLCCRTVQHADSQVNTLALTPDRRLVAAGGYQHVRMYDVHGKDSSPVLNYEGGGKNFTGIGFNDDGKWMFTGGEDCTARIWDMRAGTVHCSRIFQVSHSVNCVALHPNQCELIVGDQGGTVYLWDLRNDHNEQLIPEPGISIQHLDVDSTGSLLAAVTNKGVGYIWHIKSGSGAPPNLSLPGGLSTTGQGPPLDVSNTCLPGTETQALPGAGASHNSPDHSPPLPLGDASANARIVPKVKKHLHPRYALKCRFSPNSKLLTTTSADQSARVWDTMDYSLVHQLKVENQRWVWDCGYSADSKTLVTCSSDHYVRVWKIDGTQAELVKELAGHSKAVTAVAFCDEMNARMLHVLPIPALSDNYMYLLIDKKTQKGAVVDPVEPDKVLKAAQEQHVEVTHILTTHHHWDHAGGNVELAKKLPGAKVVGGDERIGALTDKVKGGDTTKVGNLGVKCLFTPCHTSGHICYYVTDDEGQKVVFTGDTLFIGGCGKFFEGTAEQMHEALVKTLGQLSEDTKVFCGHEYTVSNLKYAEHAEPDNSAVKAKLEWAKGETCTVPSTIGDEKTFNPFMRVESSESLKRHAGSNDPVKIMQFLRHEKDNFRARN